MLLKSLFIFFSVFYSGYLFATDYYVSNSGDDTNSGTSTSTPWKTIGHLNEQVFSPGDRILFKCGDVWRDTRFQISNSGTADNPIVYSSYGTGGKPQLLGSVLASGWTNVSGNIWKSEANITLDPWEIGYDGPQIFFEEMDGSVTWGSHQTYDASYSNVTEEYQWTWNGDAIYVYAPSNPSARYSEIEVPQQSNGLLLLDNNYITIDGLHLSYYGDAAIYDQYQTIELFGLKVINCEICYIGKKNGSAAYGLSVHHSDSYYAYNHIHNCGRRGISITLYQTDSITEQNVIIEYNHFHHGWHTTALDGSITGNHVIKNIIFRNNLVEGDSILTIGGENSGSNHVYISHQFSSGGYVGDIEFYNNIFTWSSGSSIKIGDMENVKVYNNTFYNFNLTQTNWQAHIFCGSSTNIDIKNNIFFNNAEDNRFAAIETHTSTVGTLTVDYNLYYNINSDRRMFWIDAGTSYDVDQWSEYNTATGNDANSPAPSDPKFINTHFNFGLQEESPARGKGVAIEGITTDYYGNPMNSPFDIGAIQYGSTPDFHINKIDEVFKVFPNPSQGNFIVDVKTTLEEQYAFELYTLTGKLVYQSESFSGSDCHRFPVNNLQKGVYILKKVTGTSTMRSIKVVIN